MKYRDLAALVPLGLALGSTGVFAVPTIPAESGWGGHINLGIGAGSSESNMIAGVSSIDLGEERISSLEDSPGSEDIVLPVAQFEVTYTLGENRTQFYLGNQEADALSFDLETTLKTHLGVRQEISGIARVSFSLSASSLPLDVWKDPYVVDEKRGDTERTSSGLNISIDEIFGTVTDLQVQLKSISPIYHVTSDDPPLLLIHGDKDLTVPVQQSEVLKVKYEETGLDVELIVQPGGGHTYWAGIEEQYVDVGKWFDTYLD